MTTQQLIDALERSISDLSKDLEILKPQLQLNKEGMFITYELDPPKLVVYAGARYRIHVPRRYGGWDVEFKSWLGGEVALDIDLTISM